MQRSFSSAAAFAVTLVVVVVFSSCGGGSSSNGGSGGASSSFVPGKWAFSLFSTTGTFFGPTVALNMNLVQSGAAISSDNADSVDSASCAGPHLDSSAGTVSGDKIKLVFNIDSETITLHGTLDPGGKSINIVNGTFSSSGGGCIDGQHVGFTANFVPTLTGTSTGTMQLFSPDSEPSVTAMLAEDADFNISGSMAVTGDPCFSSIAIAPDNLGLSIGDVSSFEMTDGTNVVDFIGSVFLVPDLPTQFNAMVTVVAGCTEEFGGLNLNLISDPAAMPSSGASSAKTGAHKINPLLVERMKNLIAARRAHNQ